MGLFPAWFDMMKESVMHLYDLYCDFYLVYTCLGYSDKQIKGIIVMLFAAIFVIVYSMTAMNTAMHSCGELQWAYWWIKKNGSPYDKVQQNRADNIQTEEEQELEMNECEAICNFIKCMILGVLVYPFVVIYLCIYGIKYRFCDKQKNELKIANILSSFKNLGLVLILIEDIPQLIISYFLFKALNNLQPEFSLNSGFISMILFANSILLKIIPWIINVCKYKTFWYNPINFMKSNDDENDKMPQTSNEKIELV